MTYKTEYQRWCESPFTESNLREELLTLCDEKEIEDRFYRSLEFGTAGLRGVLGAGTNRMNLHTVRQASQALSDYIHQDESAVKSVVIAYDSRKMSREFALCAALVLCKNGIKTFLFESLRPVPMLSFTVRHLKCTAGIVITASHNPPEYNGYKVYGKDGGQMTPEKCAVIAQNIKDTDVLSVEFMSEEDAKGCGLLEYIGEDADNAYYDYTMSLSLHRELTYEQKNAVSVVYSPLHGSGLVPVTTLLSRMGYDNVYVVEEQKYPDGKFPTVQAPNPENPAAFSLALSLAKAKDATLAFATDPDSDRLGVCVADENGDFIPLSGNAIGSLLIYYILSSLHEQGKMPKNAFITKSIVSTRLADKICEHFGVSLRKVLTGFRYIAQQIEESERKGNGEFLFGFEESYGYLAGTQVRDKDACLASMLICEACAYYKSKGKSLFDVLREMEQKFGAYVEKGLSFNVKGKDGMAELASFMEKLHSQPCNEFAGLAVTRCTDYKSERITDYVIHTECKTTLPCADVINYDLGEDIWVCLRPSGTEPKLKAYVGVRADKASQANDTAERICNAVTDMVKSELNA